MLKTCPCGHPIWLEFVPAAPGERRAVFYDGNQDLLPAHIWLLPSLAITHCPGCGEQLRLEILENL